jgi:hypothetical protein
MTGAPAMTTDSWMTIVGANDWALVDDYERPVADD